MGNSVSAVSGSPRMAASSLRNIGVKLRCRVLALSGQFVDGVPLLR
jgi:hypothetical protein